MYNSFEDLEVPFSSYC